MKKLWSCRLLVVGSRREVQRFARSDWHHSLGARHSELLENAPTRFACQFEADIKPLQALKQLSSDRARLTFLLDYEMEESRIKGLAKAKAGALTQCEINY